MLNVLKTEPHVRSAELSVSTKNGRKQVLITYEHSDANGRTSTVGFSSWTDSVGGYHEPLFATAMSGLSAVRGPPSDMGTGRIIRDWMNRCGVGAIAISL